MLILNKCLLNTWQDLVLIVVLVKRQTWNLNIDKYKST
jgi:hypothetical protein